MGGKTGYKARCYESHPPLPIGEFLVYGGSCSFPVVKDADVYVGFDGSMARTSRQYPWTPGFEVFYRIADQHAPENKDSFDKLIEWMAGQVSSGKKVHCGCIGGHGRTGMVLAALVHHMTGEKDAIAYVRKNYCTKAVESLEQVNFLVSSGITYASPTRVYAPVDPWEGQEGTSLVLADGGTWPPVQRRPAASGAAKYVPSSSAKSWAERPRGPRKFKVYPEASRSQTIWGANVVFDKQDESATIAV